MENLEIKNTIEELLKAMNVSFQAVEVLVSENASHPRFLIKTGDSAMLIGAKGEHLFAFNYLIRRIAAKKSKTEELPKFVVDVNDYQEKAVEQLKVKAKIMSERARSFKVDVELEPMSSYERMLVHSCLENTPEIKTESRGEGRARRVVIRYIPSME